VISSKGREQQDSALSSRAEVALLIAAATLTATYILLRYGTMWGEGDTMVFTKAIRGILDSGQLVPSAGDIIYPNGYGYQALGVFLIHLSGMSLTELQLYGSALLMVWLVVPAWLLYRELVETRRGATLATIILFVQPEFLFPIMRGSHEKFTRGLMFLCLYLLVRSLSSRRRPPRFIALLLSFYVTMYALIAFNNLMASSFTLAIDLALFLILLGVITKRIFWPTSGRTLWQLALASAASMVLAFLFTFLLYTPAQHDLLILQSVIDQLSALFLAVGRSSGTNPYAVVNSGWVSLPVYFAISVANWIILFGSLAIWVAQGTKWLLRRQWPGSQNAVILWAFFGAFAIQGCISIAVDMSGAIAGNLQHRMFPSFAMLAAPMVARWIMDLKPRGALNRRVVNACLAAGIAALGVLSVFKATNEPLLSNWWLFYLNSERVAMDWTEEALPGKMVWVGFDERLVNAVIIRTGNDPRSVRYNTGKVEEETRTFLISDVTRGQSQRLAEPLPVDAESNVTYDNGETQIMQRRPGWVEQKAVEQK
jgi:hypothetical protein